VYVYFQLPLAPCGSFNWIHTKFVPQFSLPSSKFWMLKF
jgi:hypothetical protein